MGQGFEQESNNKQRNSGWSLIGLAATLGLIFAAVLLVKRSKVAGQAWSVDDLIDAADRAAATLEHTLSGETARAS